MGRRLEKRVRPFRHVGLLVIAAVAATSVSCSSRDDLSQSPATTSEAATPQTAAVPVQSVTSSGDGSSLLSARTDGASVSVPEQSLSDRTAKITATTQAPPDNVSELFGDAVFALGDGVAVSLSEGELVGPASVTFTLPADFDPTSYVPAVVWEAGDGTWDLLESSWVPGDRTVTATTTHFSFGWPIKIDVSKIAGGLFDWMKGLATGRARAANPTCGDESAPRSSGVQVVSDSGDLVKWCYGRDNGRDVLKITNNWRAGTQVSFPKNWAVVDYQGAGLDLQSIGDWMDSFSRETADARSRLVGPGQTIVLDPGVIAPGATTTAVAEASTVSWLWSIALTAVDVYLLTLGKLAQIDKNTKAQDLLDAVAFIKCFTSYYGEDTNILDPVNSSTFETVTRAARFGLDCGKQIIQDSLKARGGILGKIGAQIVGVLASVIGVAYGLVNALLTGIRELIDSIGELFDSTEIGGFGYDIILAASAIGATTTAAAPVSVPTIETLRSAYVPSICDFPPGQLVNGSLPIPPDSDFPEGNVTLDSSLYAAGDLDGDGAPEVAVVFSCSGGGVSWPQELHVFRQDLTPVGLVDITSAFPDFVVWRASYVSLSYAEGQLQANVYLEESAVEPTAERTLTIGMSGGQLVIDGEGPPAADSCPEYPELARRGDGIPTPCESIVGVQRLLDSLGYSVDDDGQFGPSTEAAVRAFQADHGLAVTGEIDNATWLAILPPD